MLFGILRLIPLRIRSVDLKLSEKLTYHVSVDSHGIHLKL